MQVSSGEIQKWCISNQELGDTRIQELTFSASRQLHLQLVQEREEFLLKKAPLNSLRASGGTKTNFFMAPTITKEAIT